MAKTKPAARPAAAPAKAPAKAGPAKPAAGPQKVSFANRLNKMQKLWETAAEASGGGNFGPNDNVEDGNHEGRLIEAKIVETQGGKMMIEWTWDITSVGTDQDRAANPTFAMVRSRDGLETEQNVGHMKRKLKFFGFDASQMKSAELEAALEMITKGHPYADLRVWTSQDGQWQNVQTRGNSPTGWETDPWGEESPAEEEAVAEEGQGDELDTLDRNGLKKFIAANKVEVKVYQNMSDDDIRNAIRALQPAVEEEVLEEEPLEEEPLEEEAASFEVGQQVLYTPPRAKSALTCEIADGPDAAGTVKLKNLASNKLLAQRVATDQLQLAAEEGVEEEAAAEEEFGAVTKGSKVECNIQGKVYKGTVANEPASDATSVKVKFDEGPLKGKLKDVPVEDIEPLS